MRQAVLLQIPPRGQRSPRPPQPTPPHPPPFVFGSGSTLLFHFSAKDCPAVVLPLPVICAVLLPVLAEFGGEGFREQEELDVVAAGGEVFFDESSDHADACRPLRLLLLHVHLDLLVVAVVVVGLPPGVYPVAVVMMMMVRVLMPAPVLSGGVLDEMPLAATAL